jgi:hypothetical protein
MQVRPLTSTPPSHGILSVHAYKQNREARKRPSSSSRAMCCNQRKSTPVFHEMIFTKEITDMPVKNFVVVVKKRRSLKVSKKSLRTEEQDTSLPRRARERADSVAETLFQLHKLAKNQS